MEFKEGEKEGRKDLPTYFGSISQVLLLFDHAVNIALFNKIFSIGLVKWYQEYLYILTVLTSC